MTSQTSQNVAFWDINIAFWVISLFIVTKIFSFLKNDLFVFQLANSATSLNFFMRFSAKCFFLCAKLSVYYNNTERVKSLSSDL